MPRRDRERERERERETHPKPESRAGSNSPEAVREASALLENRCLPLQPYAPLRRLLPRTITSSVAPHPVVGGWTVEREVPVAGGYEDAAGIGKTHSLSSTLLA